MNKPNSLCRVCNSIIQNIFDFGEMPIANNLILMDNETYTKNEYKYNMKIGVCINCSSLQIINVPKKELMFNDHYAYFASESKFMKNHFAKLGSKLMKLMNKEKDYILEIGCNDGIFLKSFADNNYKHVGIDASKNVVETAKNDKVNAICKFFDDKTSDEILHSYGKAKFVVITNTMHHIENCQSVAKGIDKLLDEDGILVIEDPYLLDMYKIGSIEQVYAEHNFIWSLHSYKKLFEKYSIKLFDVDHFDTHGGSMRYFFSKKNLKETNNMQKYINLELNNKIFDINTFMKFQKNCKKICEELYNFVVSKSKEGKIIAGYGATAKSATTLNYSNIDQNLISCIYDSTPFKINKFTPGTHIQIRDARLLSKDNPDYTILFAWNHKNEIIEKEKKSKTIWVEYIPELKLTYEN